MQDKARRMCENAKLMIESAGSSMDKVVKVNVSRCYPFGRVMTDLVSYDCSWVHHKTMLMLFA